MGGLLIMHHHRYLRIYAAVNLGLLQPLVTPGDRTMLNSRFSH